MKRFICVIAVLVVFLQLMVVGVYAYGNEYPAYSTVSGGAWVECNTILGRGVLIIPVDYLNQSLGFTGSGYKLLNCMNSTINGIFICQNGTQYTVRATRFNYIEYVSSTGGGGTTYSDLNISTIYNTNMEFVDYTELGRGEKTEKPSVEVLLIGLAVILLFVMTVKGMRVR